MMVQMTFVLVIGLAIGGQQWSLLQVAGQEEAPKSELAVDIKTSNGAHIEMPFFSPNFTSMEPELRDCVAGDTKQIMALIVEALGSRLRAKNCMFSFVSGSITWTKLAGRLIMTARSQESKRPQSNQQTAETRKAFNMAMQAMFRQMVRESKQEAAKIQNEPKDPAALADEVDRYFADLMEALDKSPVASYVNWAESKYNGEKFSNSAAKVMAKLDQNGYGPVFTAVDGLLGVLVTFSG